MMAPLLLLLVKVEATGSGRPAPGNHFIYKGTEMPRQLLPLARALAAGKVCAYPLLLSSLAGRSPRVPARGCKKNWYQINP